MNLFEEIALGGFGGEVIDDTSAHTNGMWVGVYALEDTVIGSLTSTNVAQNGAADSASYTLTSVALSAGCFLPGRFTAITLSSGGVYMPKCPASMYPTHASDTVRNSHA